MSQDSTMSQDEFKRLWTREASNQPGMVLEVLPAAPLKLDEDAA